MLSHACTFALMFDKVDSVLARVQHIVLPATGYPASRDIMSGEWPLFATDVC